MKKLLSTLAIGVALVGCSSTSSNDSGRSYFGFGRAPEGQSTSVAAPSPESDANTQATMMSFDEASSAHNLGAAAASSPGLQLNNSVFEPSPPSLGSVTGTYVGLKISQLREDLRKLQSFVIQRNGTLQEVRQATVGSSQQYHGIVAAINARLQMGTTRNNPILVQQWNQAQVQLSRINDEINRMNNLANAVASDAAFASFLLDSTTATFDLSGAVDEDHRQLAILQDEVNRTVVLIDRLLTELSEDLRRQNIYVNNERRNLMALSLAVKSGELYGGAGTTDVSFPTALSNNESARGSGGSMAYAAVSAAELAARNEGRPLVVIRFDQPNIDFDAELYSAVSQAIQRRPNTVFDVVSVSPQRGSPTDIALNANRARNNADSVVRSLTEMGVPQQQITVGSVTNDKIEVNEVRIFVR